MTLPGARCDPRLGRRAVALLATGSGRFADVARAPFAAARARRREAIA